MKKRQKMRQRGREGEIIRDRETERKTIGGGIHKEREIERESKRECVCEREKESERERGSEREREIE